MSLELIKRTGRPNWYVRGTVRKQFVYESTGTPIRDRAEEFRAKREAELYDRSIYGAKATVTFEQAAIAYVDFTPRNLDTKKYVLRLIDHFTQTKLATIDQNAAERAASKIVGDKAAPATKIRGVYTPLTAVLNFAHGRGWCDGPKFQKPTPPDGKTRWLTPAEASMLINSAAPHLRPLLHFMLCTGARVSEALDLDWGDVDLEAGWVMFRGVKGRSGQKRDRKAALVPAVIGTLKFFPWRTGRVFRRDDGEPYASRNRLEGGQIKTAFKTAVKRTPLLEQFTPHDLRHTWATWFYAASKDLLLLKDEGAWRTLRMVERYAHLMPSHLVPDIALIWGPSHPRIGVLPQRKLEIAR